MAQLPMSSTNISLEFLAPLLPSSAPQNYTGAAFRFRYPWMGRCQLCNALPMINLEPSRLADASVQVLPLRAGSFQSTSFAALPVDPARDHRTDLHVAKNRGHAVI